MEAKLQKWGNSDGIRILCKFLKSLNLKTNDKVELVFENNKIIITKLKKYQLEKEKKITKIKKFKMRRNRMRFYTIDAKNEEEFIKEYDRLQKSRLSQLNFEENIKNEEKIIEDDEEEDGLSRAKKFNNSGDEEEYSGLGRVLKDYDEDEEDNLGKDNYDEEDILKESEDDLIKMKSNEEKGIEILYYCLKNSINEISSGKNINNKESIFYNNNKNIKAMSGNAIFDLNIRDLVDNILSENDNEYTKSSENNSNSLRDYILQNIESDNILKIMFMSNNKLTKNSFINKLFGPNNKKNENDEIYEPFEIRKKIIKLFSKNI